MKKILIMNMLISCSVLNCKETMNLEKVPKKIEQVSEIATLYNENLPEYWNNLTPEERIFVYYMYRASIPGNRIIADQTHRHAIEITEIFKNIIQNKDSISKLDFSQQFQTPRTRMDSTGSSLCQGYDRQAPRALVPNLLRDTSFFEKDLAEKFLKECEIFLIYLLAHHGQYFLREFEDHKRTPEKLNLNSINKENLIFVLEKINYPKAKQIVEKLEKSIFATDYEPTVTVDGDIEKSAGNFYSHDFKNEDFEKVQTSEKSAINNYFYIENLNNQRIVKIEKYKINGKYSKELEVAKHWLEKAAEHTKKFPNIFDQNIPVSLDFLIKYLEIGDENLFKEFSKKWLKTNSRIDFNFGFVEVYADPKQYRGSFEADITVKTVDMKKFNQVLPKLEAQLPFPNEFKRQNLEDTSAIPNASINAKLFASGDAGPVKITAAYCLPNYSEIRAEHGSKQIIYQFGKSIGELINPELSQKLNYIQEDLDFLNKYDSEKKLDDDIWDLHCLLHETLGHGSGRLDFHTFQENENLEIGGKKYKIGDKLQVTAENINEFLGSYLSGHEELRAEIIALYISIFNFDELAQHGLLKDWPQKIEKDELIKRFILHMTQFGIKRLINQKDDATEIVQAHAQANNTITNYLLDHGSLEIVEEKTTVDGNEHTVIGIKLNDLEQAKQAIRDLAIEVQSIQSTGDGIALNNLMKNYGLCIRKPEYIKILKENRQAAQGDLKEVAEIFPLYKPVFNDKNEIVDISATWPNSFLEEQLELGKLELSKEF